MSKALTFPSAAVMSFFWLSVVVLEVEVVFFKFLSLRIMFEVRLPVDLEDGERERAGDPSSCSGDTRKVQ